MDDDTSVQNTQESSNVALNVGDFIAIRDLLKISIERGGSFRAEEMCIVGGVYNKLNGFVNHIQSVIEKTETNTNNNLKTENE